jgi:hypothetical protein
MVRPEVRVAYVPVVGVVFAHEQLVDVLLVLLGTNRVLLDARSEAPQPALYFFDVLPDGLLVFDYAVAFRFGHSAIAADVEDEVVERTDQRYDYTRNANDNRQYRTAC